MEENKNGKNVTIIEDSYIQVSESRIRNTIKEFKRGQSFNGVLSSSLACSVSFLIAYVSYISENSPWRWVFLSLGILSFIVLFVFGIISLIRKKIGKGSEKWFVEELKNSHPTAKRINSNLRKRRIFNFVNIFLIVGIPVSIALLVNGLNGWHLEDEFWCPIFWVFWSMFTLLYLLFGTLIHAFFAELFFGYTHEF